MNRVDLIGNITNDLELRYTSNNTPFTSFSIAINEGEETTYVNCKAWKKQAENLCQYQEKGNKIAIEGSIKTDKYQDKNGNNKVAFYVLAHKIIFLGNKKESTQQTNQPQEEQEEHDPFSDFGNSVSIDDEFLD